MNCAKLIYYLLEANLKEAGAVIVPCELAQNALNELLPPEVRVAEVGFENGAIRVDFTLAFKKTGLKFTLTTNFVPPAVSGGVWHFDLPMAVTGGGFVEKMLLGLKAPELVKRLPVEAVKSIPPEVFEVIENKRFTRSVKVPPKLRGLTLLGVSGDDAALKLHFQLRY